MQLMDYTETSIDINTNMSVIEQELLTEKLITNGTIENINKDTLNGNKENQQNQDNIIVNHDNLSVVNNGNDSNEVLETGSLFMEDDESFEEEQKEIDNLVKSIKQGIIKENPIELLPPTLIKDEIISLESSTNWEHDNSSPLEQASHTDILVTEKLDDNTTEQSLVNEKNVNDSVVAINDSEDKKDEVTDESNVLLEVNNEDSTNNEPASEISFVSKDECVKQEVAPMLENKAITSKDEKELNEKINKDTVMDVDMADVIEIKKNQVVNAIESIVDMVKESDTKGMNDSEANKVIDCDDVIEVTANDAVQSTSSVEQSIEILDVDEVKLEEEKPIQAQLEINCVESNAEEEKVDEKKIPDKPAEPKKTPLICKLSNTLDILSDDEEDTLVPTVPLPPVPTPPPTIAAVVKETNVTSAAVTDDKQCINIDDDDDIMLIDEDTDNKSEPVEKLNEVVKDDLEPDSVTSTSDNKETESKEVSDTLSKSEEVCQIVEKEKIVPPPESLEPIVKHDIIEKAVEKPDEIFDVNKPLVPENFLKSCKKNLSDMTREELEEFCILKIVESILDRTSLNDIKAKLKSMAQNIEEYRKKAMMLTKQNRDLQVVLKSVQEEQKKMTDTPIIPLKITRSVGMQVLMSEKGVRRKTAVGVSNVPNVLNTNVNNKKQYSPRSQSPRPQKSMNNIQQIPVPRLIPAGNSIKSPQTPTSSSGKITSPLLNGVKMQSPAQQKPEKRAHNKLHSVVDLTDDEPPVKVSAKTPPTPPVRLVNQQNLMAPRQQFNLSIGNSANPRKVYIPISGPQGQTIRPGQTLMLKTVPPPGTRQRCPVPNSVPRMPQNQVRLPRIHPTRHPAPLPDIMKQYQPPNWKALPPAPDLKLSKVENGIVISWKIEGYMEDSYEDIASYQLYAYQETSSPPSTALWKKIGDVKALPLPMACTLTQFMTGFKYYFAVRAVDVKSRLGPFSLPGSILLLSKV